MIAALPRSLLFPVVLLAACAHTSSSAKLHTGPPGPEQRFTMKGPGTLVTALLGGGTLSGPDISFGRYDDGRTMRGTAFGRPLNLSLTEDKVSGVWGSSPLNLTVQVVQDELSVTGLIAGKPSSFTAGLDRISGSVGLCTYDLRWTGDAYGGSRACPGGVNPVTVQFPDSILAWRPVDVATAIAVLMSGP